MCSKSRSGRSSVGTSFCRMVMGGTFIEMPQQGMVIRTETENKSFCYDRS